MTPEEWARRLEDIRGEFSGTVPEAKDLQGLESLKIRSLGRKGLLTELLKTLKDFPLETRKPLGIAGNAVKEELSALFEKRREELSKIHLDKELLNAKIDVTLPSYPFPSAGPHPITLAMEKIIDTLSKMGFSMAEGPMIETEYYNFEALNFPADHPARDMHDTFYLKPHDAPGSGAARLLMRTHTSPVQIRRMESARPPIRIMSPGKTFRHEAVDAGHSIVFHQMEGFYVDKQVSMADLKWVLQTLLHEIFGHKAELRFRPSFFPFVEPGAEVDMKCVFCGEIGKPRRTAPEGIACSLCKGSGWLEMLGAGMIHPNVLKTVGYDPEIWSGFAFGMGVDRIAMLLFGINDIRTLYENDLRILKQIQ